MSYHWSKDDYIKHGYFYIAPGHGNGDLLYNTLRMIIETNDKSDWARTAFLEVFMCLLEGLRWPDSMEHIINTKRHTQYDMTHDPWIMFYACAVHLDITWVIEYKPPFKLYRPTLWAMRRYLHNQTKFNRWRYQVMQTIERWVVNNILSEGNREFQAVLMNYMEWTVRELQIKQEAQEMGTQ